MGKLEVSRRLCFPLPPRLLTAVGPSSSSAQQVEDSRQQQLQQLQQQARTEDYVFGADPQQRQLQLGELKGSVCGDSSRPGRFEKTWQLQQQQQRQQGGPRIMSLVPTRSSSSSSP